MESGCHFCDPIESTDPVAANDSAIAFPDGFPVSEGHMLVVLRRHVRHNRANRKGG